MPSTKPEATSLEGTDQWTADEWGSANQSIYIMVVKYVMGLYFDHSREYNATFSRMRLEIILQTFAIRTIFRFVVQPKNGCFLC